MPAIAVIGYLSRAITGLSVAMLLYCSAAVAADRQATQSFEVHETSLEAALETFARQAAISLSHPRLTGRRGNHKHENRPFILKGRHSVPEGLRVLLASTAYDFEILNAGSVLVFRKTQPQRTTAPSAEEARDSESINLELIDVTASKRRETAFDVPSALSVVGAAQIETAGLVNSNQIARSVPALFFTEQGPGRGKFILRGLADGSFNGRSQALVGTYLDQVRLTYSAPDPGIDLLDIARVEILRGPQGTLYGSGAMGGLVRLITEPPIAGIFEGRVKASGGVTRGGTESYAFGGLINIPLTTDTLTLRLSGGYRLRGGYIDVLRFPEEADDGPDNEEGNANGEERENAEEADPFLLANNNQVRTAHARGALRADITENWAVTLGGLYLDRDARDGDYRDFDLGNLDAEEAEEFAFGFTGLGKTVPFDEIFSDRLRKVFANLDGDLGFARLQSTTAIFDRRIQNDYDATLALESLGEVDEGVGLSIERRDIRTFEHETHLTSAPGGRSDWLVGLFYSDRRDRVDSFITVPGFNPETPTLGEEPFYSEFFRDTVQEIAVFGEYAHSLSDALRVTAGLRWFETRIDAASSINDVGPFNILNGVGSQREDDITPRISLSYFPSPGHHFYVQYAEGYRLGGVNLKGPSDEQPDDDAFDDTPNDPADPRAFLLDSFLSDRIRHYEAGYKSTMLNETLTVEIAAYYADWIDLQSDQFSEEGLPIAGNVGDAELYGVEVDFAFRPSHALEVRANAAFNASSIASVDEFGADIGAEVGDRLPGAPRWTAALSALKSWAVGSGARLTAFAQLSHIGPAPLLFATFEPRPSDDVNRLDLSLALVKGPRRISLEAENILNSSANQFAFGNPFSVLEQNQGVPLRPRTLILTLSQDF